ncbi:hypothetical protein BDK51DRAFT_2069, partial [Blyttiomyces helicus]
AANKNVPAFLNKLYNMVCDPSTDSLIYWGEDGTSFLVQRQEEFAREVLPRFFKHNNFASFVRQLNMYGFRKVPHLLQGVLHPDGEPEKWEFMNDNFQRSQPDLLCLMTRKKGRDATGNGTDHAVTDSSTALGPALPGVGVASGAAALTTTPSLGSSLHPSVDLTHLIEEVAAIKRHQLTISADLKNIQKENRVLWEESTAVRQRYQRQQETIDKILRFLASVF